MEASSVHCESTLIVRPEHLNHYGYMFGGRLLEWLDEQSYIAAMRQLKPKANVVTVAIDRVQFLGPAHDGDLLRFHSHLVHVGRTSLTIYTEVDRMPSVMRVFQAYVTYVALDRRGRPRLAAPLLLKPYRAVTDEERRHWKEVEAARRIRRRTV
jgi:acyl-CoA hydrolase